MVRILLAILAVLISGTGSSAQELFVYPEAVALLEKDVKDLGCDLLPAAQGIELLSPGMARNSWLTVMLLVRGRGGQRFAIHTGENPEGTLRMEMYRYFPGQQMPGPLYGPRLERVGTDVEARIGEGQRCAIYFLDLFAAAGTAPGRVRVDPSIWTPREDGEKFWKKTPLEVRVLERTVAEPVREFQQCALPVQALLNRLMDGVANQCRPVLGNCSESPVDSLEGLLARNVLQDANWVTGGGACANTQPGPANPLQYLEFRRQLASRQ